MSLDDELSDLLVISLEQAVAAPYCGLLLASAGARVIKIEAPEIGDDSRKFGPFINDYSAYFMSLNRGKESIALNLKKPKDKKIFESIVSKEDILVENFNPGTLEKWGLGWKELSKKYPKLIYASASGFGQTGPYASRPGYDGLIQAMGGVMALTGEPNGEPMKVGVPIGDLMAGMFASVGILAAVRHQIQTGEGQFIDIGMLDTHVAWLANQGMNYLSTDKNPERLGNQHPNIVPYQVMPTYDGYIVL